jgi:hypothetical protein
MNNGKTITLAGLFREVGNVEIPLIQRDYAQGRDKAEEVRTQFLEALSAALTANQDDTTSP